MATREDSRAARDLELEALHELLPGAMHGMDTAEYTIPYLAPWVDTDQITGSVPSSVGDLNTGWIASANHRLEGIQVRQHCPVPRPVRLPVEVVRGRCL